MADVVIPESDTPEPEARPPNILDLVQQGVSVDEAIGDLSRQAAVVGEISRSSPILTCCRRKRFGGDSDREIE